MVDTTESTESNGFASPSAAAALPSRTKVWLKRLGIGGFVFFFAKGMVWLVLGALAAKGLIG